MLLTLEAMRKLFRTLDGIVSLVLASAACQTTATDTTPNPGPEDGSFACTAPLAEMVTNLRPASPVDYVEIRGETFRRETGTDADAGGDAGPPLPTRTISSHGAACAGASDAAACQQALADARITSEKGWATKIVEGMVPPEETFERGFLVYTRGDQVGIVATREELTAFLGTVDTLEEARLLVTTNGSRDLACGSTPFKSGWRKNEDGSWELLIAYSSCGTKYQERLKVAPEGTVTQIERRHEEPESVCGRRPEGLVLEGRGGAAISVAAWLAEAAHLEAASVVAFRRLESELRWLGAPERLLRLARRSRADEIRHAREMGALARRFGASALPLEIAPQAPRTELEIALENAVEGCVRETYGALVAAYQARTAEDPTLRTVLRRIARDEARHAALAHEVASWLDARLDEGERAIVAAARAAAIAELRDAVRVPPAADVAHLAGMPRPREARALLEALEHEVLAAA